MLLTSELYRGFACKAPAKVLETVQAWGREHGAVVEEEQTVRAN